MGKVTDWNELIKQERILVLEQKVARLRAELEQAEQELNELKNKEN